MIGLSRERWEALRPLLDEALELGPEERTGWLDTQRQSNPTLAAEVEALLAREDALDRDQFLDPVSGGVQAFAGSSLEGKRLGPWLLERQIGKGGMGSVWLARRNDGRFEGIAAIKFLSLAVAGRSGEARFRREGNVLARLSHPNIAKLLDAGVSPSGQPYLVLEHVDGTPLDRWCAEQRLTLEARIRLFEQVLDAVAHAHARLIIHRDLKPANILVTGDGRVKLLDFGIAKLLEDGSDGPLHTGTAERLLTIEYAAPEQIRADPISTATDVYSLGVVLYRLLAGAHPTSPHAVSPADQIRGILETEPVHLTGALAGDLDNILAHALRKEPAERYQSVTALADDLARLLRHEPVSAHAATWRYRAEKFVRRNRGAMLAGTLTTLSLLAATLFSLTQMREAQRQRDAALRETRRADAQNEFQGVLLSQVGDRPITMRQIVDSGRAVMERQFAHDSVALPSLLLQLASSYAELGETKIRAGLLSRAESLAVAGYGTEGLAAIRCLIADNSRMDGKYAAAWKTLDAADSLLRHSPNPNDERTCLSVRAELGYEVGRGEESIAPARRAIALMDSLGQINGLDYYDLLSTYGSLLDANGQFREAAGFIRRAIAGMDRSGRGAMMERTIMRHNLALTLTKLGNSLEAEQILREVLDQAAAADPSGRIYWQPLIHFAEAALVQDHPDTALKYFSKVVSQAVADSNLYWEGRGLFGVARASIRSGRLIEARRAKVRLEQIIAKYRHVLDTDDVLPDGQTLDGMLALTAGDASTARARFQETLRTHGYFDGKLKWRLRPVALLGAEAALMLNELDESDDLARRARETATVDSASDSLSARVGEARLIEGRVLLMRGDTARARTTLSRALTALRTGAGADHSLTRTAKALADSLATPSAPSTKH